MAKGKSNNKTRKFISKRIKRTKGGKGKITTRTAGQDHFNARESGKVTRNKRQDKDASKANERNIKRAIS